MKQLKSKWKAKEPEISNFCSDLSQANPPSLFDDFRPLAILSKICFVLPVKNLIFGGKHLDFKWLSLEIISVPFFNFLVGYFLASKVIYENGFDPPLLKQVVVVFLLPNLWFIFGQHHLLSLMEGIQKFDLSMLTNTKAFYYKKLNKFFWVIISLAYPLLLLVKIGSDEYLGEPCVIYNCAQMEIIRLVFNYQLQLQLFIYIFFCYELNHRFKTFNVDFHNFIKTSYLGRKVIGDNHIAFENQRLQHIHLIHCTKTLNDLYGIRFSFIIGFILLRILWLLYHLYTTKGYVITEYDVMTVSYNFILLFFVTFNTDQLVVEVRFIL
jgi:hypothetical protein